MDNPLRETSRVARGRGGQGLWSKEPGPGPVRPNPKSERSCRKLDDRLREVRDLRPQKVPGGTVQRLLRVKLSLLKLLRPVKESGVQSGVSHKYNYLLLTYLHNCQFPWIKRSNA